MAQRIKRGLIRSFNVTTYTASVLILEATNATVPNIPLATHIDGTSALVGASCAVLFFDEQNNDDAVVIAVYPNGSTGIPTPPPGRITFVTGTLRINAVVINAGVTTLFTMSGAAGIPTGALGVLYGLSFTSPTNAAFIQIAPAGAAIGNYASFGNLPAGGTTVRGTGMIGLSTAGQIDIRANTGNCTVTLFTFGYVF